MVHTVPSSCSIA